MSSLTVNLVGRQGRKRFAIYLWKERGIVGTPKSEALLMSAARADLVHRHILPQLEAGTWVLSDRFTDSTLAYQGYGQIGLYRIQELNQFTVGT